MKFFRETINRVNKFTETLHNGIANNSGFSLIEILIATVLGSMILVMLYSAYSSTLKYVGRSTEHAEFYENINLAITKIDKDFSNIYFNRENKNLSFIGKEEGENSVVNFVTVSHRPFNMLGNIKKPAPYSDVHEVGYYLKESRKHPGEYELIKREELHYDENPEEGGTENVLLEGVTELRFEYKLRNDWSSNWDSSQTRRLPNAVKTTIKVKHAWTGGESVERYRENENIDEFIFISNINMVM